ncbi:hypothetical protein BV898_09957 [Hypsibius exemplaris]|uniref:Uncharacterized protein n=1 Tax=Hypsibius exemplaris TaxID=2072580 RepID=A0A1W0WKW6_HYPEX|nr:hypothetical protein BV898_09957 [Hypsibius exemplaris]
MSVSNVICTLCFGKRFEPEDPEFVRLLENNQEFSKLLAQSGPLQAYPSLRFFPGSVKAAWNAIVQINRQMIDTMTAKIQEHRNTYDSNETRDYIDKFLHHQAAEAASPNGIQPPFYDEGLKRNLSAFLRRRNGNHRRHPLNCLIWKLSVAITPRECHSLGVLRANTKKRPCWVIAFQNDVSFIPNFKSVNVDPKLWTDPLTFNPNRFLDDKEKFSNRLTSCRSPSVSVLCVGEALARMEIFLFFANIMQRFLIRPPRDSDIPSTDEYTTGISCRPAPFKIEAVPR